MRYGVKISGLGAYVPERRLTNDDLSQMVDTNDEWIVTRTGIRERRVAAPEEGTSHLATRAAREALEDAGIAPDELDLIIVATTTPDLVFPPVAALVQGNLGAARANGFDLNAVCSGFLNALVVGSQFIQNGAHRHVLVIGAETLTRIVDYTDRTTCILFGDGAGAAVLSRSENADAGLIDFTLAADGQKAGLVYCPRPSSPTKTLEQLGADPKPYIHQDGRAVFRVAVQGMADAVQTLLDRHGLTPDDVQVVVPHQANLRIMDALAQRLGLPSERVANCIAEYANTSSATIPLALHKWVRTQGLHAGDYVIFTAFAAGLLWGAALWRWS